VGPSTVEAAAAGHGACGSGAADTAATSRHTRPLLSSSLLHVDGAAVARAVAAWAPPLPPDLSTRSPERPQRRMRQWCGSFGDWDFVVLLWFWNHSHHPSATPPPTHKVVPVYY
ncbi:hypothetical protein U9M48_004934, partial [Paspalum notatum var. saurae]